MKQNSFAVATIFFFFFCVGMSAKADTLLISFHLSDSIVAYGTDGTNLGVFTSTGLNNPRGMAIDTSGNVYAANYGSSTITRYSSTGSYLGVFTSTGLTNPAALAFDASSNVYVANGNGNSVTEYSSLGSYLGVFANSGMRAPFGLAFDTNGNLYVANNLGNNITKYSPSGASLGAFASGADAPIGIAFDASNYLYVADQYNHPSVIKYAPDSSPSTFVNGLSEPVDVNIDSAGNVYVLDAVREIYEYSPSGILLNSFVVNGGSVANAFVIQPTTIVPSLSIVSSGNNIALSWPTNAAKYVLQQSFDVTTKEWTNISIEPTVTNSQNQIVLTPTNSQSFFRLSSQ